MRNQQFWLDAALACTAVFAFCVPWASPIMLSPSLSAPHAVGAICAAAVVVALATGAELRRGHPLLLPAGAVLLFAAASCLWSIDRTVAVQSTLTLAKNLIMVWLVFQCCRTAEQLRLVLTCLVLGACSGIALALWFKVAGLHGQRLRFRPPGNDPNTFGLTVAMVIPIALLLARTAAGWRKTGYLAAFALCLAAVIATASRSATLAAAIGVSAVLLSWPGDGARRRAVHFAGVVAVAVVGVAVAPRGATVRLMAAAHAGAGTALDSRWPLWQAGARVAADHWLIGTGFGNFGVATLPILMRDFGRPPVPRAAHNVPLGVAVEGGAVGLGLWAWCAWAVWRLARRLVGPPRAMWTGVLLALATGCQALSWQCARPLWMAVALVVAHATLPPDDDPRALVQPGPH